MGSVCYSKPGFAPAFKVQYFPRRGHAVVDEMGQVVSGFYDNPKQVQIMCDAKIAAKLRADKVISRPCMRCRQPFESEGIHNRMCPHCRRAGSAEGEPVGYSFGAMTGRRR